MKLTRSWGVWSTVLLGMVCLSPVNATKQNWSLDSAAKTGMLATNAHAAIAITDVTDLKTLDSGDDGALGYHPGGRDTTAPDTEVDISGLCGDNGWYRSDVTVKLCATDNYGGSGVDEIEYSTDCYRWSEYDHPICISNEGTTRLWYRAEDRAGNREEAECVEISIDKTAPTISVLSPVNGNCYKRSSCVNASWRACDDLSGIDYSTGSVDCGQPIDTSRYGEFEFIVKAYDNAGNCATACVSYYVSSVDCEIILSENGWSEPVGEWDPSSRIGVLTTDVCKRIRVIGDCITLDGNGYTVSGKGCDTGLNLNEANRARIFDLNICNFSIGISRAAASFGSYIIEGCDVENNTKYGISLANVCDTSINECEVTNNTWYGIYLNKAVGSVIDDCYVAKNSVYGILLWDVSDSAIKDSTICGNGVGAYIWDGCNIMIKGNTFSNQATGLSINSSNNMLIFHNNFINNGNHATVSCSSNIAFNTCLPEGGNYWSGWTSPDCNRDSIVDRPYCKGNVKDYFPWTTANGWCDFYPTPA